MPTYHFRFAPRTIVQKIFPLKYDNIKIIIGGIPINMNNFRVPYVGPNVYFELELDYHPQFNIQPMATIVSPNSPCQYNVLASIGNWDKQLVKKKKSSPSPRSKSEELPKSQTILSFIKSIK